MGGAYRSLICVICLYLFRRDDDVSAEVRNSEFGGGGGGGCERSAACVKGKEARVPMVFRMGVAPACGIGMGGL